MNQYCCRIITKFKMKVSRKYNENRRRPNGQLESFFGITNRHVSYMYEILLAKR